VIHEVALPPAERTDPLYALVRSVARFWLWFFLRAVEVRHRERVPARGPVLLCINHPNNLIDSLLVGAVMERKVHYLATAALFRRRLLARFLLACGAIPVYRRQDDPDRMERNTAAFAACFHALEAGGVIAIYPEGTTHAEPRVRRIRTGAARIALEHEARREARGAPPAEALALVPVGLAFEARKSFRGRVLVSVGEAIPLAPYLPRYRDDALKAVDALTTAIQEGMEAQVVNVGRIDEAEIVSAVEELYRSALVRELQEERGLAPGEIDVFRLSRAIVDAVAHFQRREPERVERLWRRILAYRALLAAYGLRDRAVRETLTRARGRDRIRWTWQAALGLPVFVYGALVNGLPYLLPRWLSRRRARQDTDYATVRLLASVIAFPLFWGLETWIVAQLAGAVWGAAFFLSLPASGLLAYRYLGGLGRLRWQLRFGALALTRRHAAARLLALRHGIIVELDRAKADYLAATHGSSS
jgi:glycerol-3-phosphate O-acyltransferase / dihydroxyacetone phosphate acyltransferase